MLAVLTLLANRAGARGLNPKPRSFHDFGAVGDGINIDTIAIRKALNSGYAIVQSGGQFLIDEEILIEMPLKLTMENGSNLQVKKSSFPERGLWIKSDNAEINGLSLSGGCQSVLLKIDGQNPQITDTRLDGQRATSYGLLVQDPSTLRIKNLAIINCHGSQTPSAAGLAIKGKIDSAFLEDILIRDISAPRAGKMGASEGAARGIMILSNSTVTKVDITRATIQGILAREGDCITAFCPRENNLTKLTISQCKLENFNRRGVKSLFNKNTITNSSIVMQDKTEAGRAGIELFGGEATINACTIDAKNLDFGIFCSNLSSGTLSANTIKAGTAQSLDLSWLNRSTQSAIYLRNCKKVTLSENSIEGGYHGVVLEKTIYNEAQKNNFYKQKDDEIKFK